MNKKLYKKLSKTIEKTIDRNYSRGQLGMSEYPDIFTDPSKKNKKDCKLLIERVLKSKNIRIYFSENRIQIILNQSNFKNKKDVTTTSISSMPTKAYTNVSNVEIIKSIGCKIQYNDSISSLNYKTLYDDIYHKIIKSYTRINNKKFSEINNSILIESGLLRDKNLNDILSN